MRSALLLILFNRPEHTRQTFAAVRAARPPRLYVAADGPRPGNEADSALCREARSIVDAVDWPCRVETLFRVRNLGCRVACSEAIRWFFKHEDEGVILEDDILAHPDFFSFCDAMLERFRHEPRVMSVNGSNFQMGLKRGSASYYYSIFAHVWGWATWARAWRHFDLRMSGYRSFMRGSFPAQAQSERYTDFFLRRFAEVESGRLSSWAYPWSYAVFRHNGLNVNPNVNLTANAGFGSGTHCPGDSLWAYARPEAMGPVIHPEAIAPCREADLLTFHTAYDSRDFSFIKEGYRRLESGEACANHELIRLLRALAGEHIELTRLEILTLEAEGRLPEALSLLVAAKQRSPESAETLQAIGKRLGAD
ncbi:MAG: hypothetical protein LBH65_02645 [Desulfovibrio sp.]|jgi:hypothetical protein|nr:hypothetical protein [Desulfovibrio sp.]